MTTTTDLASQTPVEIDTQIAALWQERYRQQTMRDHAWDRVVFYVTEVMRGLGIHKGFSKVDAKAVRDFLSEYSEIKAYPQAHVRRNAQRARDAYLTYLDHDAKADDILMSDIQPLDEEYVRRGRWNRAFLVTNGNGHVHRSMNCSTCYPTTQYYWVTDYSDHTEAEIVEAAGERACTVCYPSAPVEVLSRPTQIFSQDEKDAEQRRQEREQARREREAASIEVIGYSDSDRYPTERKVFKSERAVTNAIASELKSLGWYGTSHPSAHRWINNANALRRALEAKTGTEFDWDAALERMRKSIKREGGEAKF